MSQSMVERIAELVYEAIRSWQNGVMVDLDPWADVRDDREGGPVCIAYETAHAAIAAMRKPPENLVTIARRLTETGEVVVTEDDGEEHPVSYHGFDLGALWVAVIDDMLTEETKT